MNVLYLGLGGNIGDRLSYLTAALNLIEQAGFIVLAKSSIYKTEPWGNINANEFYNQVLKVETTKTPQEALFFLNLVEKRLGRVRSADQYEDRPIDIDILFYNDLILAESNLTIPHPRLHLRNFILIPMNEIAPDFIHPVLKLSCKEMLPKSGDTLKVEKVR